MPIDIEFIIDLQFFCFCHSVSSSFFLNAAMFVALRVTFGGLRGTTGLTPTTVAGLKPPTLTPAFLNPPTVGCLIPTAMFPPLPAAKAVAPPTGLKGCGFLGSCGLI